jgi:D-alanyl-D-alanine carboxypeptidase
MTQSTWVNPNGLPADDQITSARDMAILARAILREFPEYGSYWRIPMLRFGRRMIRNTNGLIDHYPGADGMKTGFICASGFNVVASASRNGKKLIAVVLGAPSGRLRSEKAAQLFEKGFSTGSLSWLMPSLGTVDALQPIAAAPPNLREEMCGKNRRRPATEDDGETPAAADNPNETDPSSAFAFHVNPLRLGGPGKNVSLLVDLPPSMPPVVVYTGPARKPGDPEPAIAARSSTKRTAKAAPKTDPKPAAKKPAPAVAATQKTFTPASAATKPVPAPAAKKNAPAVAAKQPAAKKTDTAAAAKKPAPKNPPKAATNAATKQ